MSTPYKYKFDEERQAIVFITDNGIHYEIDINPKQQDSLFIQKIFQNSINEYLIYKHNS